MNMLSITAGGCYMSESVGIFSNFALYRTSKSEYLFSQYFHNLPLTDTDKIICLKSNIKSVKGQVTISFLHLSPDTELTATHRFKKQGRNLNSLTYQFQSVDTSITLVHS